MSTHEMKENPKMFWYSEHMKYILNESFCPVHKGEIEGVYIETWNSADNSNARLEFAYSQADKEYGLVAYKRFKHFEKHSFNRLHIISVVLPPSVYDEEYKRLISKTWGL